MELVIVSVILAAAVMVQAIVLYRMHVAACQQPERAVPQIAPPPPPPLTKTLSPETVQLMDTNERKCLGEVILDRQQRRPTLWWKDQKYICSRRLDTGVWIYRKVTH